LSANRPSLKDVVSNRFETFFTLSGGSVGGTDFPFSVGSTRFSNGVSCYKPEGLLIELTMVCAGGWDGFSGTSTVEAHRM